MSLRRDVRAWLLAAVRLSLAPAAALGAQAPEAAGRIAGRVHVEGSEVPLAYAVVSLPSLGVERFAGADGAFVLGAVPAGAHQLRVRRIGYEPRDTTVVVPAGGVAGPLRVGLRRLAVQLAAVRVRARRECVRPGPPDSSVDPVGAAVFEQVRQNAERARLLAEQYPFVYGMERVLGGPDGRGDVSFGKPDTIFVRSGRPWRYAPGQVVGRDPDRRGEYVTHVPNLEDVADAAFLQTHCFDYAGLDTLMGRTLVRVNVTAVRHLREPDVEGAIYLDSAGFQIRWTDFSLTRPPRVGRAVPAVRISTQFQEVLPALPIISGISAVTEVGRYVRGRPVQLLENQFLVSFRWTRAPP